MDFWDLTKLLFRRWYVAGPLLLLTVAGTVFAGLRIEPDYVATSYVQLVPPAVTPKENDGKKAQPRNPWLDLGLNSLGKASMLTVQDKRVVDLLESMGYSEDFTLTLDDTQPIVIFEVIADTKSQASGTSEALVKRFDGSVAALQKEYFTAPDQSITTRRLDLGDNVEESTSKVKRALVAIGAAGLLLMVALTVGVDAALRRRATRRAAAPAVEPAAAGAAPEPQQPATASANPPKAPVEKPPARVPQQAANQRPVKVPARTVRPGTVVDTAVPTDERSGEETIVIRAPGGGSTRSRSGEETTVIHAATVVRQRTGDSERTAAEEPSEDSPADAVPEDATIVLPRPTWPVAGTKGKRR